MADTLRVATFNVENMFSRPAVMNGATWAQGRAILDDVSKLTGLLSKAVYSPADKAAIRKLLLKYEFNNRNKKSRPFEIRVNKGPLYVIPKGTKDIRIDAKGRDSWAGWVELTKTDLDIGATVNTGRVIDAVRPDILCVCEVEDRMTLSRFNDQILTRFPGSTFPFNLLVDGNDARGIDVGMYSGLKIRSVRSHIADGGANPVFSRDCAEYEIELPTGEFLWLLCNHFKSKGFGNQADNDRKRLRQATRVAEIYAEAKKRSDFVIVAGDLNDTPLSAPLKPLLQQTDLQDVMSHPTYVGPPGTFRTTKDKLDYLLLSPALWTRTKAVGAERRGIFAPRAGNPFQEVTSLANQASDHAAVWVDLAF